MAKRSVVTMLPKSVKAWLDKALLESNFSGYDGFVSELKKRGFDVSRSAVHRYGQAFEDRIKNLQIATEQAKAIVDASPDDTNAMTEALMRLVQEKLFQVLMSLEIDPAEINITKVTRAIADIARATISQKKWALDARARLDETLKGIESDARQQSGDQQTIALAMLKRIREEAYGIFQ